MQKSILIIDFGSQYTQLIARKIREFNVYCEIHTFYKINKNMIKKIQPAGIIFSGGPNSVLDNTSPKINKFIYDLQIPILGICYGLQLLSLQFGGVIKKSLKREY